MIGFLVPHLKTERNPDLIDLGKYLDPWGHIIFTYLIDTQLITILDHRWGHDVLTEWFLGHESALRSEKLRINGERPRLGESVAHAVNRLWDENSGDEEGRRNDLLFQYRERHGLQRILRGAAVSNIYIGMNRGAGEISLDSEESKWSYQFDMNDFCSHLRAELSRELVSWIRATENTDQFRVARSRVGYFLERLDEHR